MKSKLLHFSCLVMLILSCSKKDEEPTFLPELTTEQTTNLTHNSVDITGIISSNGNSPISQKGICWSETSVEPDLNDSKTTHGAGDEKFTSKIENLQPGTSYFARAYATNGVGTSYGKIILFETNPSLVNLLTLEASTIEDVSATVAATMNVENVDILEKGICWSTTSLYPDTSDNATKEGPGNDDFESELTELSPGTTYYARAYATSAEETTYGNFILFKTKLPLPKVTSIEATDITQNSAVIHGNIEFPSNLLITQRGVCWGLEALPTIDGNFTSDGTGSGEFSSTLTSLTENSTYYARAYAINSEGEIAYGEDISFKTKAPAAILTTTTISDIEQTTAKSGGDITDNHGIEIATRGICWSTTTNPTINNNKTDDGSDHGVFESALTNLTPNTTYYVRAYATNSEGTTAYGNEETFTTLPASIEYPETGFFGDNILASSFTEAKPRESYSFSAILPKNTSLKIIITRTSTHPNEEIPTYWSYSTTSRVNWFIEILDRDYHTQVLEATSDDLTTDLRVYIPSKPITMKIDFYENGAETPTKSKILSNN
ncbi:fibronectin type III domain-containing protein [Cognatitamlana onchidii]|uniref:fibronectin type III domain-containing protein n=1 Tax=Cognatitamlana onchidii TaxID=2562860 RepID=UPI0010A63294|nr:fibronectin type III domain-containing protein [Algibacter onchidii]